MKLQIKNEAQVPEIVEPEKALKISKTEKRIWELEEALAEAVTPETLKGWLLQIADASNFRTGHFGVQETKEWEVRLKAIKEIMSILKYTSKEAKVVPIQSNKIVIQVIDNQEIKSNAK